MNDRDVRVRIAGVLDRLASLNRRTLVNGGSTMPTPDEQEELRKAYEANERRIRAEEEARRMRAEEEARFKAPDFARGNAPSSFDVARDFRVQRPAPPLVVGGAMVTVTRDGEHVRLQIGRTSVHATVDEIALLVNAIEIACG